MPVSDLLVDLEVEGGQTGEGDDIHDHQVHPRDVHAGIVHNEREKNTESSLVVQCTHSSSLVRIARS